MSEQTPVDELESLLLDPTRLRVIAVLAPVGEVDFSFVRDQVGLSDSALSKQLRTLADAGLTDTRRSRRGARRRSWVRLTAHGRTILAQHTHALQEIASAADPPIDGMDPV